MDFDLSAFSSKYGMIPAIAAFVGAFLGQRVTRRKLRSIVRSELGAIPCNRYPWKTHTTGPIPVVDDEP